MKMNDDLLRERVRLLKAKGDIKNYIELAELLEVPKNGFYNWMNNQYNFGIEKKQRLNELIDILTQ